MQSYSPFGVPRTALGPAPWGFTGEWHDPGGVVYLRARWYNPAWGRFTQVDPFPGMLATPATRHPYLYGLNNPLRFSDPAGLFPDWEEAREKLQHSLEFVLGAGLQYTNDMTWGLYGEGYRLASGQTLADVASPAFQRGRQLGRGLSTAVGVVHAAVGTTAVILGLSAGPPTAGAALAAATPSGGLSIGAGAVVLTVEGLVVVVGAGEAVYGASILAYAKGHPLEHRDAGSCGPTGGDVDDKTAARLTRSEARARRALGLSKREFRDAIHAIKDAVEGNPDMLFDPATGDVYDRRSLELVGNLLDELD
jgi:RHS repeat-associated protein